MRFNDVCGFNHMLLLEDKHDTLAFFRVGQKHDRRKDGRTVGQMNMAPSGGWVKNVTDGWTDGRMHYKNVTSF